MKTKTAHLAIRPDLNISDREVLDKRVGLYNLLSLGPARFAAHHFVLRCGRDPHRNSFYAVKTIRGGRAVRLQMGRIDHQPSRLASLARQLRENLVKHARRA